MKEWNKTAPEAPAIETHGLGPCVGIAIHNPARRQGYMAHIATPLLEHPLIQEMLAVAVTDESRDGLKVWLRGSRLPAENDDGQRDFVLMGRDIVTNSLEAAGLSPEQIDVQWDEGDMTEPGTRMILDAETGEFQSFKPPVQEAQAIGLQAVEGAE